jgi:hypothetical protein
VKRENILMLVVGSFLFLPSKAIGQVRDIHILGRVYDTDQVNRAIDDADLLISVSGRPHDHSFSGDSKCPNEV